MGYVNTVVLEARRAPQGEKEIGALQVYFSFFSPNT